MPDCPDRIRQGTQQYWAACSQDTGRFLLILTPRETRDYLDSFDSRIVGLHGTAEDTEAAAKVYHVYYQIRPLGNGEYSVDHSSFLYVVRPDGGFAELLAGDIPSHSLAEALRRILQ